MRRIAPPRPPPPEPLWQASPVLPGGASPCVRPCRPDPKEARMAVQRWTSRRRAAFLTALSDTGNVSAAARAAGASRSRAYQLKAADPGFAAEWADALEAAIDALDAERSEEHTSELQSLMRISYAVFCLTKNNTIR